MLKQSLTDYKHANHAMLFVVFSSQYGVDANLPGANITNICCLLFLQRSSSLERLPKKGWQKYFQRVTQKWIAKLKLSQKSGKRLSYETYDLTGLLGNQTGNPSRGSRGEEERMLRCQTFEHQVLATVSIASGWSLSIWLICLLCRVTEVDSLSARAKVTFQLALM